MNPGISLIAFAGRRVTALVGYLGELVIIITTACAQLIGAANAITAVARTVLWKQVQFSGVDAVPFTALLALLTSLSVVVQVQLIGLGQSELLGKLMVVVMVRELGPLIVAMIILARSGTAIATELATMRVCGEIRSLSLSGVDPFEYLVVPRLAALAIAMFCLAQVFIFVSLFGGYVLGQLIIPDAPNFLDYAASITAHLSSLDAFLVVLKTIVPGLLIGAIACREGLGCGLSFTQIPRTATHAVVRAFTAVVCWDALITSVFYLLGR